MAEQPKCLLTLLKQDRHKAEKAEVGALCAAPITVTWRCGCQREHLKVSVLSIYVARYKFSKGRQWGAKGAGLLLLQAINTSWSCARTPGHVTRVWPGCTILPLLPAPVLPMAVHMACYTYNKFDVPIDPLLREQGALTTPVRLLV